MGKRRFPVLTAPDPALLSQIIPAELIEKIAKTGVCLISDIDGTIVDSAPVYCRWLARKLRQPISATSLKRYDFKDVHSDALSMLQDTVFCDARMHKDMPLVVGAKESLVRIDKKGIPIVVLTSRPAERRALVAATAANLERNGVPLDLLVFSRRKKEIIEALRRLLPDVRFVVADDDPRLIISVSRLQNVTAVLITASYNLQVSREGIVRAGETPDDPNKWLAVEEVLKMKTPFGLPVTRSPEGFD